MIVSYWGQRGEPEPPSSFPKEDAFSSDRHGHKGAGASTCPNYVAASATQERRMPLPPFP